MTRSVTVVLAGVIERDDGRLLVSERAPGTHLAGFWEFPGGKCEPGETHEQCLRRELLEELGVEAHIGAEILTVEHAYPDRVVRLHFRRCRIEGEPRPMLRQRVRWVERRELRTLRFPAADRDLIDLLSQGCDGRLES
jgi:8-oxo-dGTP diphosphatase